MVVSGVILKSSLNGLQYKSRYEGDLVAKCYFAKHKIVWEVLDGCLKNKIEIPWSDIMALKANYPDDGPGTLEVVVSVVSLFDMSVIGVTALSFTSKHNVISIFFFPPAG